ncbi:MAG: hypothetical protein CMH52_07515 [Myxococcales bacterium]|nr:hypothetical protein [Myxococcales bacterium]
MYVILAALIWFPDFSGTASVAHDLGLDEQLRGRFSLSSQIGIVQEPTWHLGVFVDHLTYVRSNRRNETPFRISPEQIHFPVGAKLSFPMDTETGRWGLLVKHQSNHDIDSSDQSLARETLAYEYYALFFELNRTNVDVGVYYDRGTRLSGRQQVWPFDYLLAGANLFVEWPWTSTISSQIRLKLNVHRNENTAVSYFDFGHALDLGWRFSGVRASSRLFLSMNRVNNYQFLGDQPRNLLLLGLAISSIDSKR